MLNLNLIIIINVYLQSVPARLNRLKRLRLRAIYTLKYNNNNNNSKAICITTANCQYRNWSEFYGPSVYAETLQGSDAGVLGHSSPASGPAAGGGACGLGWGSPRRRLWPSSPGGRAASPALWELGLHDRTGLARWCAEPVSGRTRYGRPAPQSARCATQRWRTQRHLRTYAL